MEMDGLDEVYRLQRFLPTAVSTGGRFFTPCKRKTEDVYDVEGVKIG